jgi:hypothetical protein
MKSCKKLSSDQKNELKTLIKLGYDAKEIRRRAQAILFLDAKASYKKIETLTQFKERSVLTFRKRYFQDGLKSIE